MIDKEQVVRSLLVEASIKLERNPKFKDYKWLTSRKNTIPLQNMDTDHLYNCIRKNAGYKNNKMYTWDKLYAGHTREEWLEAFEDEWKVRNNEAKHRLISRQIKNHTKKNNKI